MTINNGKTYVTYPWLIAFVVNIIALAAGVMGFLHFRDIDRIERTMQTGFTEIKELVRAK